MNTGENRNSSAKLGFLFVTIICMVLSLGACSENINADEQKENLSETELPYTIVGTNQVKFYNNWFEIPAPEAGQSFYGQDAGVPANKPNYTDNKDNTITDNITGLMWQKNPGEKMTWEKAVSRVSDFNLGGYNDWRLPTIKELYSLIIFSGVDPSGYNGTETKALVPFINTDFFEFEYGDPDVGERIIDAQFATSTMDVGDSKFGGGNLMFGVNFADGRIKGCPTGPLPGQSPGKTFFVLYVRANENYGKNNFADNGNGTVTDYATGLMWMQNDSGKGMNWQQALEYAEEMEFAGFTDWRLPNAKELQSIVDYSRAPGLTNSGAINPVFNCTEILNEAGQPDYGYYWSCTTHVNMQNGGNAVYLSFGRAMGYFNSKWQDVHGAGAQRSDPKTGNAESYPYGHGPQGDAIRINNFVRLVRNVN